MGPLDGIKVVDLSRVLAGPWCTMTLGDLGADVWKIENPTSGDDTRSWQPPEIGGEATYYLSANRNKRSIAINLKHPKGVAIVRELIAKADVLVENMRRGTLDRLGLGWEEARAINPRLIYCSISGYGRVSPASNRPGYDVLIQAESGLMAITGEAGGQPLKYGIAVVDISTGMNAVQAILAALIARGRTGQGQFIDIALLDTGVALLANIGTGFINAGVQPARYGNAHPTVVPYQTFEASDSSFVLACGNDQQFARLCSEVLLRPDMGEDARFLRNRDRIANRVELIQMLTALFRQQPAAHWLARLAAVGIPSGTVRDLDEVFSSPEVVERGLVNKIAHRSAGEVSLLASPLRLSDTPTTLRRPPPMLGEHTAEVLGEVLHLDEARIEELTASGVIR